MMTQIFRKCRFTWDSERSFDGWTDDTRWNGFLNVEVDPAVHKEVKAYFKSLEGDDYDEESWEVGEREDNGRFSYAYGFATYEDEEPVN